MTNGELAERIISDSCPQRERAVRDLTKEMDRKRCGEHPRYKASLPPDLSSSTTSDCQGCWRVWQARGNPPPP